jgi:hypothetical protein
MIWSSGVIATESVVKLARGPPVMETEGVAKPPTPKVGSGASSGVRRNAWRVPAAVLK